MPTTTPIRSVELAKGASDVQRVLRTPRHEVLLGYDNIVSVANGPDGVEMEWECYCGQHGRLVSAHRHEHAA